MFTQVHLYIKPFVSNIVPAQGTWVLNILARVLSFECRPSLRGYVNSALAWLISDNQQVVGLWCSDCRVWIIFNLKMDCQVESTLRQ